MTQNKMKLLFIAPQLNGFIKNDLSLLEPRFDITTSVYNWYNKFLVPYNLAKQFFFLILFCRKFDRIMIHFGGYWSLLPVLFGKIVKIPTYVVLHGTDSASIPSIQYGSIRKFFPRMFCRWTYHHASILLPVSDSLIETENNYSNDSRSLQGIRNYFPDININYQVIHNGLDIDFWKPMESKRKPHAFISVFTIHQFNLKGGDLIIEIARERKDLSFILVGISEKEANRRISNIPSNVHFKGIVNKKELRSLFSSCKMHLQLSLFEGFGLALCEAMLCECVPIGSSVNMIPEIIGESGFILKNKDKTQLLNIIDQRINYNLDKLGQMARKRIMNNYSNDIRKKNLLKILDLP